MFQAKATDDGARGAIALVIVFIAIDPFVRIRRRRTLPAHRIRPHGATWHGRSHDLATPIAGRSGRRSR